MTVSVDSLVQVCDADGLNCQWVQVSELVLLPSLSVADAQTLGTAFIALLAGCWVWRKLQQAF